jgi:hypothetical protein
VQRKWKDVGRLIGLEKGQYLREDCEGSWKKYQWMLTNYSVVKNGSFGFLASRCCYFSIYVVHEGC